MKQLSILILFVLTSVWATAQDTIPPTRPHAVGQKKLTVTLGFTTNLIFPYSISNVDVGSRDILVKKSGPAENVLLLKAAKKGFAPTNLSVYTKDGKLYSYRLSYADSLAEFNYSYAGENDWTTPKPYLHRKIKQNGVTIKLTGIYFRDGLIWISFTAENKSEVEYYFGTVRFIIRDKKASRKKVVQEESWGPVYAAQPLFFARGPGSQLRYGFTARAPDTKKEIVCEWADGNGERRIRMVIPARLFLKAKTL